MTTATTSVVRLSRAALAERSGSAVVTAPPRIVHLGLGAFHRAHQAWYTAHATDAADWGIAAFTGRSPKAAEELAPQDGLYTLIERSAEGDTAEIVTSVVEVNDGADIGRLVELLIEPTTAVVTLTITEPAYRLRADGQPNLDDPDVAHDIESISSPASGAPRPSTVLGRLIVALDARRRAGVGGIAIVPCDNIPDNGELVRVGLTGLARLISSVLAAWIEQNVSFVTTSIDRITPRTTDADRETAAALTGFADAAPVVTEPFKDWVLSGDFPAGRPAWESAGATFVDDIEPFERRKLWLLNGAHSLLAYAGLLRGHTTVAEAMNDSECRGWVRELWDADARNLPAAELQLDDYRTALEDRFDNARIAHQLAQIAMEGSTKLRVRIAPVLLAERAAGRDVPSGVRAIASWIALTLDGTEITDAQQDAIASAAASDEPVRRLVDLIEPELARDADVLADIGALVSTLRA
ncbi:fructuronate reductase [Paramicrobacterium humi]|uniref:Fructuronate reductase n=1 Tax=Paramicrobacterium humi TaxID=640635 RepID=A0A1H4M5N3_9MICO|nr:mannitol dehydrogenase family protein [Microbacterium humi]SEB78078.1 fructuronate reductase [Microbacterium humi]